MAVPGLRGLRIPDDLDGLAYCEFSDLGFVEVGANLDSVEVGFIEEIFAGGYEVVVGDRDGVDGSRERGADVGVGIGGFSSGEGGAGIS